MSVDQAEIREDIFEVWDMNVHSFWTFLDLATQWNAIGTMAGIIWLGLDYTAALAVLEARPHSIKRQYPTLQVMDDLRVMEAEALEIRNEPRR